MKYKVGIFGSAEGDFEKILTKAQELGRVLAEKKVIVVTGASTGIPFVVARNAYEHVAEIWGFSPATNLTAQRKMMEGIDNDVFSKLFFIPKGYLFAKDENVCRKYRNVTSTATCDAGIIISGRWGTMNEFTNLFDMGKIIGVLTGTGGIADELESLMEKINKPSKAKVFFSDSPNELIKKILSELEQR